MLMPTPAANAYPLAAIAEGVANDNGNYWANSSKGNGLIEAQITECPEAAVSETASSRERPFRLLMASRHEPPRRGAGNSI